MIALIILLCGAKIVSTDNSQNEANGGRSLPNQLFLLDGDELYQMNLTNVTSANVKVLLSAEDYDLDTDRLLWIDSYARIHKRPLITNPATTGGGGGGGGGLSNKSNKLVLQYQPSVSTARIAYDQITRKFYVIDGESQEIDVVDESNDYQTILFERGPIKEEHVVREKPRRIVLDVREGLMFIVTTLNGVRNIYRSNMDGTSRKFLITGTGGEELATDYHSRRIYWCNSEAKVIESADYGGTNRAFVAKIQNPSALTVYDRQLFWLTHENGSSVVKTCQLDDEVGCVINSVKLLLRLNRTIRQPRSLKAYGGKSFRASTQSNSPCRANNGGCRHMCLLTSSPEKASCACNIGWRPTENDSRDCRMVDRRNPGDRDETRY